MENRAIGKRNFSCFEDRFKKLILNRRVAIIGLGNASRGDDGFGIRVAESIRTKFPDRVFLENDGMESIVRAILNREDIEIVIFLDVVDAGAEPGTPLIAFRENIKEERTSHGIPLTLYMSLIEKPCCLVGIQPRQLDFMSPVSEEAERASRIITALLTNAMESSSG